MQPLGMRSDRIGSGKTFLKVIQRQNKEVEEEEK